MPEILPPQIADVQQRPFYVKVRSVCTVVSTIWLILAIAGYGFFSGGTTSLALSLTLMYGTGIALLVVASALYRLVKRSAVHRTETAPDDAAAAVFLDATRSATEELMEALVPARHDVRLSSSLRNRPDSSRPQTAAASSEDPSAAVPAVSASGTKQATKNTKQAANKRSGGKQAAPAETKNSAANSAGTKAASKPANPAKSTKSAKPANPANPAKPSGIEPDAAESAAAKPAAVKSAVNKKAASKKKRRGKGNKAEAIVAAEKQVLPTAGPKKPGQEKTAAGQDGQEKPAPNQAASNKAAPGKPVSAKPTPATSALPEAGVPDAAPCPKASTDAPAAQAKTDRQGLREAA